MKLNLIKKLDQICRIGFEHEQNVIKQKLVYTSNAICLLSFFVCSVMAVLKFLFVGNFYETTATFFAGLFLLLFIYFNKLGYNLIGRVTLPLMANLILLAVSVFFTHDSYLDIYFLFICNTTLQLFDYSERKWAYLATGFSIVCLLIETTGLQQFLPAYNMISPADLPNMNVVLIVGIIIFAIVQARIFVIVRRYKEVDLTSTQSTLKLSQADLRAQQEEMEAFGIAVTHDLKAPISLAHFNLNLISRHLKKKYDSDEDLNDFVKSVHLSVSQMENLILAYLSFNKVKNLGVDLETINVREELDHILKSSLHRSGAENVVCMHSDLRINTNRYLFNTIMQNMIENGLKHNLSPEPKVIIDVEKKPGMISFLIKDNGIGIDPKFSKYLFKPFKRFNTHVDGSGLGLAVAKRASEKLNGHLYCKETSSQGTVFVLDLAI